MTELESTNNTTKYIGLYDDNNLKQLSLNDNVYFTLRDIFRNTGSCNIATEANDYNTLLTNGIYLGDRKDNFQYTNVLHQLKYVNKLRNWLNRFDEDYFDVEEFDKCKNGVIYMKFDDWWKQFEELRDLIDEQYEKCCKWEEEVRRDMDKTK